MSDNGIVKGCPSCPHREYIGGCYWCQHPILVDSSLGSLMVEHLVKCPKTIYDNLLKEVGIL